MPIKERLQKRLAEKRKAAGASTATITTAEDTGALSKWDNSVSKAAIDAAEESGRSLVEEMILPEELVFDFPANWSVHRRVTALSLLPPPFGPRAWQGLVENLGLCQYYSSLRQEIVPGLRKLLGEMQLNGVNVLSTFDVMNAMRRALFCPNKQQRLAVGDALLVAICEKLDLFDCFSVGRVCRRWHFVGRQTWNLMKTLRFDDLGQIATAAGLHGVKVELRPSKMVYRVPLLTHLLIEAGVRVNVESLACACQSVAFLMVLHLCDVELISSQVSISDTNEKVCQFIRSSTLLGELVVAAVQICFVDRVRNRREVRCLDFRGEVARHVTNRSRVGLLRVQLDAGAFHRHKKQTLLNFCGQLLNLRTEALVLSGPTFRDYVAGLSELVFKQCFVDLMLHLREISFCNISFPNTGKGLSSDTMDLLAKAVRRNSNLELFCLSEGEISEEAICNLQRCGKLQVIILLRCEITKADPDLRFMAGWHPNAALPSALITDAETIPQKLRPRYFRVVRVKGFSSFGEARFSELRKRWWTFQALLKSAIFGLADFSYVSPPLPEQEHIIADFCSLF